MPVFAGSGTARRQYSRNWDYVMLPKKDTEGAEKARIVFTPIMDELHAFLCKPWLDIKPKDARVQERLATLSHWSEGLRKSIPCLMEQEEHLTAAGQVEIQYIEGERNRCEHVHLTWGKKLHDLVNDYGRPNEQAHLRVWLWSAPPPDDPALKEILTGSEVLKAAVEAGKVPNYGRPAIMRVRSAIYRHIPQCTTDPDRMNASDYSWVIRLARPDDGIRSTYYINNLDSEKSAREEYAGRTWAIPKACAEVFRKIMQDDAERGFMNSYVPDNEEDIEAQSRHVLALLQELEALACSKCGKQIPKDASLASVDWSVGPVCPNGCAADTKQAVSVADVGIAEPGSDDDPFKTIAAEVDIGM